jgi:hypothetical protein
MLYNLFLVAYIFFFFGIHVVFYIKVYVHVLYDIVRAIHIVGVGYIWYDGSTETNINLDVLKKKKNKTKFERKRRESWIWEWWQVDVISISRISLRIIVNKQND